jgi:hypothetical protein
MTDAYRAVFKDFPETAVHFLVLENIFRAIGEVFKSPKVFLLQLTPTLLNEACQNACKSESLLLHDHIYYALDQKAGFFLEKVGKQISKVSFLRAQLHAAEQMQRELDLLPPDPNHQWHAIRNKIGCASKSTEEKIQWRRQAAIFQEILEVLIKTLNEERGILNPSKDSFEESIKDDVAKGSSDIYPVVLENPPSAMQECLPIAQRADGSSGPCVDAVGFMGSFREMDRLNRVADRAYAAQRCYQQSQNSSVESSKKKTFWIRGLIVLFLDFLEKIGNRAMHFFSNVVQLCKRRA